MKVSIDKTDKLPLGFMKAAVLLSFAVCIMCIGAIIASWMHGVPAGHFWRDLGIFFTTMVVSRRHLLQTLQFGEERRFSYSSGLMMAGVVVLAFILGLGQVVTH